MSAMEVGVSFKLGGEEEDKRLQAARELAEQLSAVECPWHKKTAKVQVATGDAAGDLTWAINEACCPEFQQELTKLIDQAGG